MCSLLTCPLQYLCCFPVPFDYRKQQLQHRINIAINNKIVHSCCRRKPITNKHCYGLRQTYYGTFTSSNNDLKGIQSQRNNFTLLYRYLLPNLFSIEHSHIPLKTTVDFHAQLALTTQSGLRKFTFVMALLQVNANSRYNI